MKTYQNANSTTLILERGEEVVEKLTNHVKENSLTAAWLVGGLGGASSATIAWYDPENKEYVNQTFDEPLEIISMSGNLAIKDGEKFWHIHTTLGRQDYTTISGHVTSMTIGLTGEILITELDAQLERNFDEPTGLYLIS